MMLVSMTTKKILKSVGFTTRFHSYSTNLDISGIYPPIPTPFLNDGEGGIDYEKLNHNFLTWNKSGLQGYVVMGSNGESISLKGEEKLELLRNVRKMGKPGAKIIAGLGMPTVSQTVELCNQAWSDGSADAGLIITPSFYKGQMTSLALIKFYEEVCSNSKLPIILYSVPANTGVDIGPEVPQVLAKHPNCIGMKDSGGDITKISRIVNECREDGFQVVAGSAGFLLPALLMGCVGGICALANILPAQVSRVYSLFKGNRMEDVADAVSLQRRLLTCNLMVTAKYGVPGLKAAMDSTSGKFYGGPSRKPLRPLEPRDVNLITEEFRKNGFPLNA